MAASNTLFSSIAIFLTSLALFHSTTSPLANAQSGLPVQLVGGTLCCTRTANCPGPALRNTTVQLVCNVAGRNVIVAQNVTNDNGVVNIAVTPNLLSVAGLLNGITATGCFLNVPVVRSTVCPLLSAARGDIVGLLVPVTSPVGNAVVGLFSTVFNLVPIPL